MKQGSALTFVRGFSVVVAAATFFLLIAGASVTSTGSGLAVPDWPLSFGQYFPKMEGGVFFEHGHRMSAGAVGILIFLMTLIVFLSDAPSLVKRLCGLVSCAVLLQALLGGMTVLFHLPAQLSVTHALLAQVVFLMTIGIAVFSRMASSEAPSPFEGEGVNCGSLASFRWGMVTVGILLSQTFLGALLRHTGKGLEVHMAGALVATLATILYIRRILLVHRETYFFSAAAALAFLLVLQLFLGFAAWRAIFPHVVSRTAHVVTASLLMAGILVLALTFYVRIAPQHLKIKSRSSEDLRVSPLSRSAA